MFAMFSPDLEDPTQICIQGITRRNINRCVCGIISIGNGSLQRIEQAANKRESVCNLHNSQEAFRPRRHSCKPIGLHTKRIWKDMVRFRLSNNESVEFEGRNRSRVVESWILRKTPELVKCCSGADKCIALARAQRPSLGAN